MTVPVTGGGGAAAPWGEPIARFERAWQRLEARLCAAVLVAEIAALTSWVSLKGLSTDFVPGESSAGLVYRALAGAALLGAAAFLVVRRRAPAVVRAVVSAAVLLGLLGARAWAHALVGWSSNVLNWLQNASVLMLVGGLRGLATRLTLWLALLGASLATSSAKHIQVDLAVRFMRAPLRARAAVAGWLGAGLVCAFAVVGFVDYIGIAEFRASAVEPCAGDAARSCDAAPSRKLATVGRGVSSDLFLLERQASLDVRSLPRVLLGVPYDRWMTAAQWNDWLASADWSGHFGSAADRLKMDPASPSAFRMPQVTVPGTGEEARGLLVRELNFVFPFGLAVIAAKFFLRALLAASGRRAEGEEGPG